MSRGLLPRQLPLHLVRFGRSYPRMVAIGAALTWIVALMLASRVQVETDILSLVPRNNPVVEGFRTTVERFGSVDTLLVVIHLEEERALENSIDFADRLAQSLRDWDDIDWVEYRVDSTAEAAVPLLDRAALFLEPAELDEVLAGLDAEGLEATALRLRAQLMAPQSLVTKDFLRLDPVGMLPKILAKVRFGGVGVRVDPDTGCLIDDGRRFLLMMAKPERPAQDLEFDRYLVTTLEERVDAVSREWIEDSGESSAPRVEFTGGYVVALDDARLITSDMVVGLVSSLVGVMVLFLLAFRSRAALVYAFFPLVTGIALTFSFGAVALGRINSLTSAFGGLVIGLGIDFVIVLYARYIEERQNGTSHPEAVDTMGRFTGVGVLLGAVTTAATFYSFLVTDFAGLWELGLLTGTGILLLVVTVYLLLPAMLTLIQQKIRLDRPLARISHRLSSRGRRGAVPSGVCDLRGADSYSAVRGAPRGEQTPLGAVHRRPQQKAGEISGLYLRSFGADILCRAALSRPRRTIVIALVVTVLLGVAVRQLRWDDDFRNMRSGDNRAIELRQEVMDAFNLRFSPMVLRFDGANETEALAKCRTILPELEELVDGENLVGVDTIAGVVPPEDVQRELIARLDEAEDFLEGLDARFEVALRGAGLNPVAFRQGVDHLVAALARREPLSLSDLEGTPLARIVERYVAEGDGEVSSAIYCYPPVGKWRRAASPALVELLAKYPDAVLAGPNVISAELRKIVWDDAIAAAILGIVIVFVLMWADLGGPLRALLALLPLFVGMVWMLGGMALIGLRLNFFNIFVLTMIVGIGVDYGIHLLHRWYESDGDPTAVSETAKAIAVAAMTTMVGFGSLVLSHYPGLRSVGGAAILGALSTAILSITLLPALLSKKETS